jgi:hypothetical protein
MEVKNLRKKRQFLNLCQDLSAEFEQLSFKEVIEKITNEIDEVDSVIIQGENEVIEKYKNKYLKNFSNEGRFFGNELELIYIKDLSPCSYTDEWHRTYLLTGSRINFSVVGANYREFSTNVDSMYTHSQLKEYVEITEDEFNSYFQTCNRINDELTKILKP